MEPIYMWLIGAAVVIIIAGAVAVYFTGRRKKPVEVPAAGELSRTQQIQALEGALGIPPSMRLDAAQSAAEPTVPMSVTEFFHQRAEPIPQSTESGDTMSTGEVLAAQLHLIADKVKVLGGGAPPGPEPEPDVPPGMVAVRPTGAKVKPGTVRYYPVVEPNETGWTYYTRVARMIDPVTGKPFANASIAGALIQFPWGGKGRTSPEDMDWIMHYDDWEPPATGSPPTPNPDPPPGPNPEPGPTGQRTPEWYASKLNEGDQYRIAAHYKEMADYLQAKDPTDYARKVNHTAGQGSYGFPWTFDPERNGKAQQEWMLHSPTTAAWVKEHQDWVKQVGPDPMGIGT